MHKTKQKQTKKSPKSAIAFALDGMILISTSVAIGIFNQRLNSNQQLLKVYAPKTGLYHFIYQYGSIYLHQLLVWLTNALDAPGSLGIAIVILTILIKLLTWINNLIVLKDNITISQRQHILLPQLKLVDRPLQYEPLNSNQSKQLKNLRKNCLKENKALDRKWPLIVNMITTTIIFIALYQSIAYSHDLDHSIFLGINLTQRSLKLTVLSSLLYALGNVISWMFLTPYAKAHDSLISYLATPFTTFMSGYFLPSIIPLYWITSAVCLIVQRLITHYIFEPIFNKQALKTYNPKIVIHKKDVTKIIANDN